MKKLVLPLLSVAVLVVLSSVASAEIKLTDNLSISGFLDMSSVTTMGDETDISASFDQFELDFTFTDGAVTGRADIDSTGDGSTMFLEQGFVSYALPKDMLPGASITVGRFASSLGFEGFEPVDLYQYSYSEGSPYPLYQNGVALSVSPMEQLGIYVAAVSGVWDVNDRYQRPRIRGASRDNAYGAAYGKGRFRNGKDDVGGDREDTNRA